MTAPEAAGVPEAALVELTAAVGSTWRGDGDGRGLRVGIACSEFNGGVTVRLLRGALAGLRACNVDPRDVTVAWVPGAFELPLAARAFAGDGSTDAVVCLGAVIRGETGHYDLVAHQCAAGVQRVALDTGVPVAFGVLATDSLAQAMARSEPGDANKGREAALAAVTMARLLQGPARRRSPSRAGTGA
ncbi:MAG TPA: 6,7-dimethyl-8-ribityllumazine synthase [Acidimicrobiales bacterium]|nr:6,7-dimethyl-8-ribityllumazine synthase [Acidimicrobiales bacterium]